MATKTEEKVEPSTREDRVAGFVTQLETLCSQAEASKDAPKPVADFVRKVSSLVGYVDAMNGDAAPVLEAIVTAGADLPDRWQSTLAELRVFAALATTGEGPDRSEGDALAKKLSALVDADLIDDESEVATFTALVERWKVSAPKGSKKSGSGSSVVRDIPSLGFTVTVGCEKQGCGWSASTSQDNLNSIRRQAQVHSDKKHGQPMLNGQPLHRGITEALAKVGMSSGKYEVGTAAAAQGGGFTVTRKA